MFTPAAPRLLALALAAWAAAGPARAAPPRGEADAAGETERASESAASPELPANLRPARRPPSAAAQPGRVLVPVLEAATVHLVVMGWNIWPGEARWSNVSSHSIARNARSAWVIDDDEFYTNQLLHPYQGAFGFAAARSAGLGFWASAPFAFASSLAWELAGETERPSVNDQITTTFGGVVLGELTHRLWLSLHRRGGWREVPAALVSPFASINRGWLGEPDETAEEPGGWEVSAGALAASVPGARAGAAGWASGAQLTARLVHGIPWSPALALRAPFDHYVLEAGFGQAGDARVTLLLRALVAGRSYTASRWRGLRGAFVLFDLDTPGDFRTSSSGVGLGSSGGMPLGHGLALEATGVVGAVLMGAAGKQPELVPDGRDYLFGVGPHLLAEVALGAGDRAALRLVGRQTTLVGVDGSGARERIGSLRAAAQVRVAGAHGLGVEAGLLRRSVHGGGRSGVEDGRTFQLFYVWSPHWSPARGALARL